MKTNHIIFWIVAIGIVGSGIITALATHSVNLLPLSPPASPKDDSNVGYGVASSAEYSGADPRYVIGYNQDVFVGKVIQVVGHEWMPRVAASSTQFAVKVIYNIKGNLQGTATIAQNENFGPLAWVGSIYIFAITFDEMSGWYRFGFRESYQLLSDDETLTDGQLREMSERDPRVIALQQAYPNEVLSGRERGSGPKYNVYANRCLDANGDLIDDTVQVIREKQGLAKAQCVTRLSPEAPNPSQELAASSTPTPVPTDPEAVKRDDRRIADIRQLQLAAEQYFDAHRRYPNTLDELVPYIPAIPKDPRSGSAYHYALETQGKWPYTRYHFGASLEVASNAGLQNDTDFNSLAAGWHNGFDGTDSAPCAAGDAGVACYDVGN